MRSEGKWKFYSVVEKPPEMIRSLFRCVRIYRSQSEELAHDLQALREVRNSSLRLEDRGSSASSNQR